MSTDREKQNGANTVGQSELIEPLGAGCEDCWSKTGYPRDYWRYRFAESAMQSLINEISWQDKTGTITPKYSRVADMAVSQADAMLNALESISL